MDAATAVALAAALLAAVVAVVVPWLAFRFTLRQDQSSWLREQRAQVYADLLTEAYATEQTLLDELQVAAGLRPSSSTGLPLPPRERAHLGSRGTMYASREVMRLFNRYDQIHAEHTVLRDPSHPPMAVLQSARVALAGAMEDLQAAIRKELGADEIRLHTGGGRRTAG
jgi:hypothetical protein